MTTDDRLQWLSSQYAQSEPGQIAGELLTARAALRMVEHDIRSIQSMGGRITDLSPRTRNAIVAALNSSEQETSLSPTSPSADHLESSQGDSSAGTGGHSSAETTVKPEHEHTFHPDGHCLYCQYPLCSDCPPVSYPTDKTRCAHCPRRKETEVDGRECGACGHIIPPGGSNSCSLDHAVPICYVVGCEIDGPHDHGENDPPSQAKTQ